jgi:hypothetical protein
MSLLAPLPLSAPLLYLSFFKTRMDGSRFGQVTYPEEAAKGLVLGAET